MKKFKYYKSFLLLLVFLPFKKVLAGTSLLGDISCIKSGNCGLNDMVQVGVNGTQVILELSGSLALLFFIYGGITFLMSGGSAEKVSTGKQIILNSIIGLLIIFTSFVIIKFSMDALGFTHTDLFGTWNQSL